MNKAAPTSRRPGLHVPNTERCTHYSPHPWDDRCDLTVGHAGSHRRNLEGNSYDEWDDHDNAPRKGEVS